MFLECFRMIYLLYNDLLATLEIFFIANGAALTQRPLPRTGGGCLKPEWRKRSRRPPAAGGQAAFVLKDQNTYFVEIPIVPHRVLAGNRTEVRSHRVKMHAGAHARQQLPARAPEIFCRLGAPAAIILDGRAKNVAATTSASEVRRARRRAASHLASDIPV